MCRWHGADAPQRRARAKRRLDQAADVLVQRLLGMALDGDVAETVALQAIIAALDRAGLSVKHAVEIGPAKPFETVFDELAGGSRAEFRASRGVSDEEVAQLELQATDALPYPDGAFDLVLAATVLHEVLPVAGDACP